uniref:NADH-ubiquinone oxidoreductase chain 5 n=1 Tax=Leptestheria brevirostris TaxID=2653809 RepID=A0A7M1ICN7_9CRUS|nr:NADH dehydrogenase subunit 5 [Leptestheria brevirostris]QOQ37317.1 NADH dehydrogenase subunit 5 [Leptestheria brevirostris]
MSSATLMISSVLCLTLSLYLIVTDQSFFIEWAVLEFNSLSLDITIFSDWMSSMFLSTVTFISSIVVIYSESYMTHDKDRVRFLLLVLAFVLSMVVLIVSANIFSLLLGWDGLGLVSYCLVIFYQSGKSSSAGMITALSNRIGDVCLIIAIALYSSMGTFNFFSWVGGSQMSGNQILTMTFIMMAATTKSAQIPFSAWLPAAMAAPTPVSALVHSSTLVTAGVYLLIRFSPMLSELHSNYYLLLVSSLTMFMAGLSANFENDLKKVIALSTLSQLGLMMFSISMGLEVLAFFHLITHALFKALLFLSAGLIIHTLGNTQDIRAMGGITKAIPLTSALMNMASLSLCGFPFLAGFYSKDLIIEMNLMNSDNFFITGILMLATAFTASYSMRLSFISMNNSFMSNSAASVAESDKLMIIPMFWMGAVSVMSGSMIAWALSPLTSNIILPTEYKMATLVIITVSAIVGYTLAQDRALKGSLSKWLNSTMWFLPALTGKALPKALEVYGKSYIKLQDQGWTEKLSSQGMYEQFSQVSKVGQQAQYNSIKTFMLMFLISVFPAVWMMT